MTDSPGARRWFRRGALAAVALVIASYGSVLYTVADVVGEATMLVALVGGALLLATLLARFLRPRTAFVVTVGLLLAGLYVYLGAVPESQLELVTPAKLLSDTAAMLSGLSVLRLLAAGTWALTVAPGPTFLAWYLAVRRRYALAVSVAGATLGLFVLTGDADATVTLLGVVAGAVAVALGNLASATGGTAATGAPAAEGRSDVETARRAAEVGEAGESRGRFLTPGTRAQLETLTAVVAAMILVSSTVGLAAGGGVALSGDGAGGGTTATLVSADDNLEIAGTISLSPKVRLLVQSDRKSYWRTAVYDRYTGDGWVRTQDTTPYENGLASPPGETRTIRQTVVARTDLDVMPAANAPVRVGDAVANRTLVTPQGGLRPAETLASGENYTVVSEQPVATPDRLRRAGRDYPASVAGARQIPSSTPDRVARRTAEIAGDEPTAYDTAVAVERYLEETKNYSLVVDRPSGDVADAFLFEMDAGYCMYFATTMAVMLRTQGIPARLATGYTPGQVVADDGRQQSYVVRGMNAHVWVEVYFPDVGWVRFDPTPAGPRVAAEEERLRTARAQNESDIDTLGSENRGPTPTPTPTPTANETDPFNDTTATPDGPGSGPDGPGGWLPSLPSSQTLGLWLVGLVGAVAASRRTGLVSWARQTGALYYQPRRDPETDVRRAWHRVEDTLGRRYRERRPGETPRAYLDALDAEFGVDPWARDVAGFFERARYGAGVTESEAAGAVQRADALTRRSLPLVGRRYRR
ncbi:MAG: DUF3488 and DUF4129 domain-containing transglutaminase family protein [Haloferacaceae archaeon]